LQHRVFIFLAVLVSYLGWVIYQQDGWTLIVTLEVIWLVCTFAGINAALFINKQVYLKYDPPFLLVIVFIVSVIVTAAFELSIMVPSSNLFDLASWDDSPFLVMFGWFNWPLGIIALTLACSKPNKPLKQDK
jgi:hypothetical protein